jgi:Na+-driven multidrug efflux pump
LRVVAPFYAFTGIGMLLYFASQGAGRVLWPFLAGSARLLVTAGLGWLLVMRVGVGITALFGVVAAGAAIYGVLTATSVALSRRWGERA